MLFWSLAVALENPEGTEAPPPTEEESVDPDFEPTLDNISTHDWTMDNWWLFPFRRIMVFSFLALFGTIGNLLIPINFVIVPALGILAWVNNYY